MDVRQIGTEVERESRLLQEVRRQLEQVIVGQSYLIERLQIGLLCNAHLLVEGVPGLAKTLSITTLAQAIDARFRRIQFTPDLLPADLIGTLVYHPGSGEFTTRRGPIFANVILADEINRAPAKVQSALLEAMQERQVTIGDESHLLDDPFMVLATQNPIEQEGTYPLPEAQVDRFMLKLRVTYPSRDEELRILRQMARTAPGRRSRRCCSPPTSRACVAWWSASTWMRRWRSTSSTWCTPPENRRTSAWSWTG